MNDRAPIRDRSLILRILVPGLEARLRDKMKESNNRAAAETTNNNTTTTTNNNSGSTTSSTKERILDLEGVMCEPTSARNHTLWSFHCDGASYPALLVNLPCPVELHKTHDHAAYYKSADIAQMLIVYEDDMALEEATEHAVDGFPSYYHSGLTPPMKRVVERRFAAREHKAVAPPRAAVADVEVELVELMEKLAKDEKGRRNKVLPTLTTANKILEEVVEEVVYFEPWMNDHGKQPGGVEFEADDQLCSKHPEVWLSAENLRKLKDEQEEARLKKQAAAEKKEAKRKKKTMAKQERATAAASASSGNTKKGIASKKNEEPMDDVTQAAMMIDIDEDFDGDNFLDLNFDEDDMLNFGEDFKDNTL